MPNLLNWIWQGSALTFAVALAVCRLRSVSAATRERIWWATLAAVCLMPLVPLVGLTPAAEAAAGSRTAPLLVVSQPSSLVVGAATLAWALWVTVSLGRLAAAMTALHRTKGSAVTFPAARLARLSAWARVSSQGRQATLAVSDRVKTAAVLGLGRPVIVVSPHVLDRLSDDELQDILMHEYGHVQRFDDLGMLLQRAITAVFGLHPAVWWLSRALTLEREVACDDLVLAQAHASSRRYARSLIKLVEQARPHAGLELVPGALFSRPQLTQRIVRLLDRERNASATPSRSAIGFAAAAIGVGVVAIASVELVALAAPMLTSRHLVAGLVEPFAPFISSDISSAPLASGPARAEGSLERTMDAARSQHNRASQPAPPAAEERPPALVPQPTSGASGSAEPTGSKPLSADALEITTVAPPASESPASPPPDGGLRLASTSSRASAPRETQTPWGRAADAASAVGRGSRTGAIKTAGFFTRIGKSVAGAF